jgi:hypothetical protein
MSQPEKSTLVVTLSIEQLESLVATQVRRVLSEQRDAAPAASDEWLDADQAARVVGCHPKTLRIHGAPVHRIGRLQRYRRAELDDWIERRRTGDSGANASNLGPRSKLRAG